MRPTSETVSKAQEAGSEVIHPWIEHDVDGVRVTSVDYRAIPPGIGDLEANRTCLKRAF